MNNDEELKNEEVISEYDELEIDEESEDEESQDLSKEKVVTEKSDTDIETLLGRFRKGKINLSPDFQRNIVWDIGKASKLIESCMLDIPIPMVYLAEEQDGSKSVIDGQQRLTALLSFIDGKFPLHEDSPEKQKKFKLSRLSALPQLSSKTFDKIDEYWQNKILSYPLHVITFKRDSTPDLRFEIFSRLNKGSVQLNEQELRNCIYRGKFNSLVNELAEDKNFRHIVGIKNAEKRMKDRELVLRFASFYFNTYIRYKSPIKKFLNDTMSKYKDISEQEEKELRTCFKNSVEIIKEIWDNNAFRRYYIDKQDGYWDNKTFNTAIYDVLMNSFANKNKNSVFQKLDEIRSIFIDLITRDQEFIDSITIGTSDYFRVKQRFQKWNAVLDDILSNKIEPRCFPFELKRKMFNESPVCSLCGNEIRNIDSAELDHIEPFSKGGQTIEQNAQLTHRHCNRAKSNN